MTAITLSHLLPDSSTISQGGVLHIANHSIPALAQAYGTPLYKAFTVSKADVLLQENVCISGRYYESGDMLVEDVLLPALHEGDLLVWSTSGAYCLPMSSNYNLFPRPAVLLVDENDVHPWSGEKHIKMCYPVISTVFELDFRNIAAYVYYNSRL